MFRKLINIFRKSAPKEQVICGECGWIVRQEFTDKWIFSRGKANGHEVINTLAQQVGSGLPEHTCDYLDHTKIECLCSCH